MTTQYNIPEVAHGINSFGTLFCDTIYSVTLAAATEASVTVPGNGAMGSTGIDRYLAVFSYKPGTSVWVSLNATATVPAGATLVATRSALNPTAKQVKAGDVIHMITATAATDVSVEFYAIQE
jgi:dUTPase